MKPSALLVCLLYGSGGLCAFQGAAAAATSAVLVGPADMQPVATSPADVAADMDFLLQAWRANDLELDAARLALQRSRDVRVRQFARVLVREHSAVNLRFQRLAALRGLGIPKAARATQAASEFGLEGLRGVAFDRHFISVVGVRAHRDAIALFETQARQGRDRAMTRFASSHLPKLREHLARAEALQAQFDRQRRNFAPVR